MTRARVYQPSRRERFGMWIVRCGLAVAWGKGVPFTLDVDVPA